MHLMKMNIETIVFCKSTQVGGEEPRSIYAWICHISNPRPSLIVYPTLDLAEYASKNRLEPMIELCHYG